MESSWMLHLLTLVAVLHVTTAVFRLNIVHTNDMHARFEQTNKRSSKCGQKDVDTNNCYGGFARVSHLVKEVKKKADNGEAPPVIFLNAGDTYQGTVWFSVHKWRIVAKLSSMLGIDAASLGNHEFDDGVSGLVPFINNVSFPVLASNLDLSKEPTLAATELAKSTVLNVAGKKIGIIGYLTTETKDISSTGQVIFLDEVASVRAEAEKLKREGVSILIALGHAGYDMDKKIAAEVADIDVVIGGHTNTFLYTGTPPDSTDEVDGKYPTVIRQKSGRRVPVVQAYAYTKYLGNLSLTFDDSGEIINWMGNPILLDKSIPQDPAVLKELAIWRVKVESETQAEIGTTRVFLNGDQRICRYAECNMGNLITDAMVDYYVKNHKPVSNGWSEAPIALQNGGGIRGSIDTLNDKGIVTMSDLLTTLPFDNSIVILKMRGEHLVEILEWSVYNYDVHNKSQPGTFLQMAGLHVKYDVCKPQGKRVISVMARCGKCNEPIYQPLNLTHVYGVLAPTYIVNGGDGFQFHKYSISEEILDITDTGALAEYIKKYTPIYPGTEGRITLADLYCLKKDSKNHAGCLKSTFLLVEILVLLLLSLKSRLLVS